MSLPVVVVGGGWSGLAAAVALIDAGHRVTLIDAAPQLGGRARRVDVTLGDRTYPLDNGQHLLIGAYSTYLALARRVGIDVADRFAVRPFALRYPDGFRLAALSAPAPLHLAGALLLARGLTWSDRIGAALWVQRWKGSHWSIDQDVPAASLFVDHPPRLVHRLWAPLCLAALNVRLDVASARVFLRVLGDSLGAAASASHLYLARGDLSALLPDAAARAIEARGSTLRLREPVLAIERRDADGAWRVRLRSDVMDASAIVLALPPARAAALLVSCEREELRAPARQLEAIETAPIATVYLRYAAGTRLAEPVYALDENASRGDYGQWVFDRGQLEPHADGILSVIVSGRGEHEALPAEALADAVARQLSRCVSLDAPRARAVFVEKRATIVPAVGLSRPATRLPVRGVYLASDAADSPYPSTLEGSVRAGLAAAEAVVADLKLSAA